MAPSSRWGVGRRHSDPQNNSFFRDNLRNFTGDISGNIVREIIGDFIDNKKGDIVRNFSHNMYNFEQFDLLGETRSCHVVILPV